MKILSGIQPSGQLHIGNYFGMMKTMISHMENSELYVFIVDLHALTSVHDGKKVSQGTLEAQEESALQEKGALQEKRAQDKEDKITISTQRTEDHGVRLSIEDNGPGVPDRIMSQIFDPFYTTKEVGKGTGLGLSIVYGFVNELGGRIEVENTPLTRFNVFFPAARSGN